MNVSIHNSKTIINYNFHGSKSLTHRFLLASFLSKEKISFSNIAINDDINATINALKALNASINFYGVDSCYVISNKPICKDKIEIDVNESASTLRFILPLALNFAKQVVFITSGNLINRPLDEYTKLSTLCNFSLKKEDNKIICSGSLSLDEYDIDLSFSSQYVTGLIVNAIYLNKAITINLHNISSLSYIKLTIDVFNKCGFNIELNNNTVIVHNNKASIWDDFVIEGDYSSAAPFIALGALNGSFESNNLHESSSQPDYKIIPILKSMGANIRFVDNNLYVKNTSLFEKGFAKRLNNIDIDVKECIDLAPLLMVVGAYNNGTMHLINVDKLIYKESNRLKAMIDNLTKLNVNITYKDNMITIIGKKEYSENCILDSYNDHRIIMALTVFSLLNKGNITINNIDNISKSFPEFFDVLIKSTKEYSIEYKK